MFFLVDNMFFIIKRNYVNSPTTKKLSECYIM